MFDWFGGKKKPSTMMEAELQLYDEEILQTLANTIKRKLRKPADYVSFGDLLIQTTAYADESRIVALLCHAGACYYKGELYDKAIACWKTLVDNCHDISHPSRISAEYFLGRIYFDGDVVPQDRSEAMVHWGMAAQCGDIRAQMWNGILMANLHMYSSAAYWLSLAAERGASQSEKEFRQFLNLVPNPNDPEIQKKIREGKQDAKNFVKVR